MTPTDTGTPGREGVRAIRVVVADDSSICRQALRAALEADGDITVVGEAEDADGALACAVRLRPDLVTMDIQMPGDGLTAIERIMAEQPLPILVVTSYAADRPELAFEATQRGALDVCGRPAIVRPEETLELRKRVRRLASLPVVRHVGGKLRPLASAAASAASATRRANAPSVIAIASSAGGPGIVAEMLRRLAPTLRAPVALVQHLSAGFTEPFARYLQAHSGLVVEVVHTAVEPRAGHVYIAAPDRHLLAAGPTFVAGVSPAVGGYRPSADVLFESLVGPRAATVAAIVLTGLGSDGADGLVKLRRAGALTLVQDPETATVAGMPRAAIERGGATEVLGLEGIIGALTST